MDISSEAKKEVLKLLESGEKIKAIDYLVETFGVTASQAQLLVDVVEREALATPENPPSDLHGEVTQLLHQNKRLEAVQLVRVKQKSSLKEALDFVQAVQKEIDPSFVPVDLQNGCSGNVFRLVSVIFGVVGIIFMAITVTLYVSQEKTIENSERIEAVVTELNYKEDGMASPIISYTWQGVPYTHHSNFSSNPPTYDAGEQVFIFVNRDDPKDIVIDSFSDRWLIILILGIFAVVFTGIAIIPLIISRKILRS